MKKFTLLIVLIFSQTVLADSYSRKVEGMLKAFPAGVHLCQSGEEVEIVHFFDGERALKGILFKLPLGDFGALYNINNNRRSLEHSPQELSWFPFVGYKLSL